MAGVGEFTNFHYEILVVVQKAMETRSWVSVPKYLDLHKRLGRRPCTAACTELTQVGYLNSQKEYVAITNAGKAAIVKWERERKSHQHTKAEEISLDLKRAEAELADSAPVPPAPPPPKLEDPDLHEDGDVDPDLHEEEAPPPPLDAEREPDLDAETEARVAQEAARETGVAASEMRSFSDPAKPPTRRTTAKPPTRPVRK